MKVYAPKTAEEVQQAATDLASARFIAFGTWKWTELQMETGGNPVYRYLYARVRPPYLGMPGEAAPSAPGQAHGAVHSGGRIHSSEPREATGNGRSGESV